MALACLSNPKVDQHVIGFDHLTGTTARPFHRHSRHFSRRQQLRETTAALDDYRVVRS
jgi:hypothetical protein